MGAGFAGLAAAILFHREDCDVSVFEKAPGPTSAGGAISLATNALACLSILGVRERVVTEPWSHLPATIRTPAGRVLVRRTLAQLTGGSRYSAVPRHLLLSWLTDQVLPDCLHYSSPVTRIDDDGVLTAGTSEQRFDLVVAADGAHGACRQMLWPDASPLRHTGIRGWSWIADREVSTGLGTIWGCTDDFGILPLHDGRTYVYGGTSRPNARLADYHSWPDPLPCLIEDARSSTVSTPQIFEAGPPRQFVRGKVALIGDAAHTMRPTFGQGASVAMEDAITLARGGVRALSQRRTRLQMTYAASKAGSYFATPNLRMLEKTRNGALALTPDPLFSALAGSVSRWRPPPSR